MIKRINIFDLAEGRDPDEVWKFWVEVHAEGIKKIPGLKRYVINRVIQVIPGPDGQPPPIKYWGLVEMWFDNMEECNRALTSQTYIDCCKNDGFGELVGSGQNIVFVEEKVLI